MAKSIISSILKYKDIIKEANVAKRVNEKEQLRDCLVLPFNRKLQYITSSIDNDQVLRETFDKVETLQQKNMFLLVDEVQIHLNAEECNPSSDLYKEAPLAN
ncbi:hypothetical protein FHG87_016486 [Trinorchestia longiramus]|nr:hypothetical protein FHG87_016486 [Trinorchestia longiramus]